VLIRLEVAGFKAFGSPASIELAPLTLLCGANSSGKSTLFQALLVLSQSVISRYSTEVIQLNGTRVQLGAFVDAAHRGEGPIRLGLRFELTDLDRQRLDMSGQLSLLAFDESYGTENPTASRWEKL
jgi:predicted ATPase